MTSYYDRRHQNTSAKRYNDRMDSIFEKAKSEKRGLVGNSGVKGHGVNSPAMKEARSKALNSKIGKKNANSYKGSEIDG